MQKQLSLPVGWPRGSIKNIIRLQKIAHLIAHPVMPILLSITRVGRKSPSLSCNLLRPTFLDIFLPEDRSTTQNRSRRKESNELSDPPGP